MNTENEAITVDEPAPNLALYNDVYFKTGLPYPFDSWAHFPRLPTELRLRIWQLVLQRHRMIYLTIHAPRGYVQSRCYVDRNHLRRIVSGRDYTLSIPGQGHAPMLSPLLRVNRDARQAALDFYHIQLPFPRRGAEHVLYLNAKYDVVLVRPSDESPPMPWQDDCPPTDFVTAWVDLLHDFRAYDLKDKGIAHLALHSDDLRNYSDQNNGRSTLLTWIPDNLHHAAAASFAEILRTGKLRSVLFIQPFRDRVRGMAELPTSPVYRYHFAQTFPFYRRDLHPATFDWLEKDPRKGVEHDLSQVPLGNDPRLLAKDWHLLEDLIGVKRGIDMDADEQYEGGDNVGKFRLYICPTLTWRSAMSLRSPDDPQPTSEEQRADFAEYLQEEAIEWRSSRQFIFDTFSLAPETRLPRLPRLPRHGRVVDAETFEAMERAPSTTVGMWLFPAHAFKEPTIPRKSCFDLSGTHPGLILFEF